QYTSLAPRVVEDIRHVTAVEGSQLTLLCRLNKDVASATLVEKEGEELTLARDEKAPHAYSATMTLTDPKRYKLKLVDYENRSNQVDPEIVLNVPRNKPPSVTIAQPGHDVDVSPLEELRLKVRFEDDFGLVKHGLSYTMPGREPVEMVLGS